MNNKNYPVKYKNQIKKRFDNSNSDNLGNVYDEDFDDNNHYSENNFYAKKYDDSYYSSRYKTNQTSIIGALLLIGACFIFFGGYYFVNDFKDKEDKMKKEDLKKEDKSVRQARDLKEKDDSIYQTKELEEVDQFINKIHDLRKKQSEINKQLSVENKDSVSSKTESTQKPNISKSEPVEDKPVKDTWQYFRYSEDQLIEEVKDSRINDYNYCKQNKPYTADEARETLIYICKSRYFYKLLDEILTNGFAPKFTTATNTLNLNPFVVEPVCSPVNADKEAFLNVLIKHNKNLKAERLSDGYNLLHAAAVVGNANIAKIGIKAGIPIDKTSSDGTTPVVLAIKNGFYELVKLFAENGAEIKPDFCEYTNDRDILKFIIHQTNTEDKYDLNFESKNKECEEAYDYLKNFDYNSIETLVDCGADLSKMSYDGEPTSLLAVRYGNLRTLKLFVSKFDCSKYKDSINGRNTLHYAVMFKRLDILKYLLKQDYDVNVPDKFGNTPLFYAVENRDIAYYKELLKYGADANYINNKKMNPLFYAIKSNNTAIFSNLVKSGADINQKDINGNTPILFARIKRLDRSEGELVKLGADPNSEILDSDYNKRLLSEQQVKLHSALLDNDIDALRSLIIDTRNPDLANSKKQSVLHLAVQNNNIEAVKLLLREGASINQPDENGNTPLHYIAMYASNSEMLDTFYSYKDKSISVFIPRTNTNYLYDYYFDFSLKNKEGKTPREISEPDCFEEYEIKKGLKDNDLKTRRVSKFYDFDEKAEELLDYIPTMRKLKKKEHKSSPIERERLDKFLNKMKQDEFNKIYGNDLRSNSSKLLELRADFLKMDENALIEEFKKLNDFNKKFNAKSQDNRIYLDVDNLFFIKIALDKDYSELLQEVLYRGFNLDYWKINYVPPVFYAADKNSQKCLKVLENNNFDLSTKLSYVIGRPYNIYTNRLRSDKDVLYHLRYIRARNRDEKDWAEIIMNLDDNVFDIIGFNDDREILEELDLGKTLLHCAAQNGNIELAKKIIANGISVDTMTEKGNTPLFYAVKNNKHEMASFLINQGAKTNEKINKIAKDSQMIKILEK